MDEELNSQRNKALVSNNHADGEVHESSRDGKTNTFGNIPHDAKDVENDFGLLKNVDAMTADNIPQVIQTDSLSVMSQEVTSPAPVEIKCSRCNKGVKIYSGGQCKSCYNYLHLNKEKHKLNIAKWKGKNPTYFRDYYRMQVKLLHAMEEKK